MTNLKNKEFNALSKIITSATGEENGIAENTVKDISYRLSTDEVIQKLNEKNIMTTKDENFNSVFDKIKNYINKFTNEDERSNEIVELSQIIGGVYHTARTSAIINNI